MSNPKTFGQLLADYRYRAGLSQKELAELSGISLPQISRYETDNSMPRPNAIAKLASVLNLQISDLIPTKKDTDSRFVDLINRELKKKGITKIQLAELTGLSLSTIADLLSGKRKINYFSPAINAITKALEINTIDLAVPLDLSVQGHGGLQKNNIKLRVKGQAKNYGHEITDIVFPDEIDFINGIKQTLKNHFQESEDKKTISIIDSFDLVDIKITFKTDQDINLMLDDDLD